MLEYTQILGLIKNNFLSGKMLFFPTPIWSACQYGSSLNCTSPVEFLKRLLQTIHWLSSKYAASSSHLSIHDFDFIQLPWGHLIYLYLFLIWGGSDWGTWVGSYASEWMACAIVVLFLSVCVNLSVCSVLPYKLTHNEVVTLLFFP